MRDFYLSAGLVYFNCTGCQEEGRLYEAGAHATEGAGLTPPLLSPLVSSFLARNPPGLGL